MYHVILCLLYTDGSRTEVLLHTVSSFREANTLCPCTVEDPEDGISLSYGFVEYAG